jgi:hypothetical protein
MTVDTACAGAFVLAFFIATIALPISAIISTILAERKYKKIRAAEELRIDKLFFPEKYNDQD